MRVEVRTKKELALANVASLKLSKSVPRDQIGFRHPQLLPFGHADLRWSEPSLLNRPYPPGGQGFGRAARCVL